jgi:uncharacterized metal-binding protein YceD (DUF177 family)
MTHNAPSRFRVSDLPQNRAFAFDLAPDAEAMAALAARLDLDALRKLGFAGTLEAEGKGAWRLQARLGATVVQPCVVTLAPVTTRIDETVIRRFLPHLPEEDSDADEIEMPEDETIEQLGPEIDLAAVMEEALALALPLYPRADRAHMAEQRFTEPGKTPMSDEDVRPFAGLKALRDKLEGGD